MSKKTKTSTKKPATKARSPKGAATAPKQHDPDLVPLTVLDKQKKAAKAKKTSGLDAAVQVLKASGEPMRCKDMVDTMLAKGLWKTGGKTPAATIYSAILREINTKGRESRFKRTDRGLFTVA